MVVRGAEEAFGDNDVPHLHRNMYTYICNTHTEREQTSVSTYDVRYRQGAGGVTEDEKGRPC